MTEVVKLNRRQTAKAATRAALLIGARALWARPGSYEAVGIREISAMAGVSTGAFFNTWPTKADCWREAMGYEPPVDSLAVRSFLQRVAKLREAA